MEVFQEKGRSYNCFRGKNSTPRGPDVGGPACEWERDAASVWAGAAVCLASRTSRLACGSRRRTRGQARHMIQHFMDGIHVLWVWAAINSIQEPFLLLLLLLRRPLCHFPSSHVHIFPAPCCFFLFVFFVPRVDMSLNLVCSYVNIDWTNLGRCAQGRFFFLSLSLLRLNLLIRCVTESPTNLTQCVYLCTLCVCVCWLATKVAKKFTASALWGASCVLLSNGVCWHCRVRLRFLKG